MINGTKQLLVICSLRGKAFGLVGGRAVFGGGAWREATGTPAKVLSIIASNVSKSISRIHIGSLKSYLNKLSNSSIHQRNSLIFRGKMAQAAMDKLFVICQNEINLKPEQRESIMNLLNGRNILAVLPTGFGKSLIFQMFVIAQSKLSLHNTRNNDTPTSSSCLVIFPLESIIEDQIVEVRSLGTLLCITVLNEIATIGRV